jgi:hypothetical protein
MFSIFDIKPNTELDKNSDKNKDDEGIDLELGDVIRVVDPANEIYNSVFFIDYLDPTKIVLIDTNSFKKIELYKNEDGTLSSKTIKEIQLLYRNEKKGYAQQNGLLTGKWINIYFREDPALNNDVPEIITGEITNLEEDMIEVKRYPSGDVFYINFDYQGIPLDIPLDRIELRNAPEKMKNIVQKEVADEEWEATEKGEEAGEEAGEEGERESGEEGKEAPEKKTYEKQTVQYVLNADAIEFQDIVEEVVQYAAVDEKSRRFSLEDQLNDMLNDILSTIPTQKRTNAVMQNIHKIIERYSQLRQLYSNFDEYDNIQDMKIKGPNYKPMTEYFEKLNKTLYWILPVAEINPSMFYSFIESKDGDLQNNLETMERIRSDYENNENNSDNRFYSYMKQMDDNTTFIQNKPFNPNDPVVQKQVGTDMLAVFNNPHAGDDFNTSTIFETNINRVRFYTEKYLTGFTKLESINAGSNPRSKEIYVREPLTDSNTMNIRSFLTLPEPTIRFSKINLPNTSIMERANLALHFLNYWQALKRFTNVKDVKVNDEYKTVEPVLDDKNTNDNSYNFISEGYKQFIIELKQNGEPIDSQYKKFVDKMIPNTGTLVKYLKKYFQGKLSLVDMVTHMEPFMIYTDDITSEDMTYINQTILRPMIQEYTVTFDKRAGIFSKMNNERNKNLRNLGVDLNNEKRVKKNLLLMIQNSYNKDLDIYEITNVYDITPYDTDSEVLTNFSDIDYGKLYYYSVALKNSALMFSDQLTLLLNEKTQIENDLKKENDKPKTCKDVIVSKIYFNLEQLEKDNSKDIYFDQKYDKTNYGLIYEYTSERTKMPSDQFVVFLKDKLSTKLKLPDSEAQYLADTLIRGKKLVINGQYALLDIEEQKMQNPNLQQNAVKYLYYVRENNMWKKDETIQDDIHNTDVDDQNILCNVQDKCASITTFMNQNKPYVPSLGPIKDPGTNSENSKTQCISTTENDLIMKQSLIQEIVDEFDERYAASKDEHERDLKSKYDYAIKTASILKKMYVKNRLSNNNQKYLLGLKVEEGTTIVISPYASLLNKVLGQSDMVKKQHDIVKFKNRFTRQPIGDEPVYYLYCVKSGAKLLPLSLYQMAYQFINNYDGYPAFVELLVAKIGAEYEDRIVDEHTGVTLKMIEHTDDEGYENGFRVTSREVMKDDTVVLDENGNIIDADVNQSDILKDTTGNIGMGGLEELGKEVGSSDKVVKKYTSPEDKMILNIVHVLQSNMHIDRVDEEFILNNVTKIIPLVLMTKEEYEKKVAAIMKTSNKKPVEYSELRNEKFLYYTAALFLISIQISVPPISVKRTFYGCKKISSFDDYPLHTDGNKGALEYIVCVMTNIRSSIQPWNTISKKDKDNSDKLENAISKIMNLPDVERRVKEKLEYLKHVSEMKRQLHVDGVSISEKEDSVTKWSQFLPPFATFKIRGLENITPDFKKELLKDIHNGFSTQQERILVVQSKIKAFSLLLQERIHNVIQKKELLLRNRNSSVLYIENACCNELGEKNTIKYFEKEEPSITRINSVVVQLVSVLRDVDFLSSAKRLQCTKNVNIPFPKILDDYDENTIYLAFVHYCHFKTLQPIPTDLLPFCGVKIEGTEGDGEVQGKPGFIKHGDSDVEIIANMKSNNIRYEKDTFLRMLQIVHRNLEINTHIHSESQENPLDSFKDLLASLLEEGYDTSMVELFMAYLNSDNNNLNENADNFINYLDRANKKMKEEIMKFFKKSDKKKVANFNKLMKWENIGNEGNTVFNTQTVTPFLKTLVQNFASTFPNILLHGVSYRRVKMGKHMNLSETHQVDIARFVRDYYEELQPLCFNSSLDRNKYKYNSILEMIQLTAHNILLLSQQTPALDPVINSFLYEYYFLKVIVEYINLCDNMNISIEGEVVSEYDISSGNLEQCRKKVAELLLAFIDTMNKHKGQIDITYENIAEQMFRIREKEKNKIRERLTKLTEEEKTADNEMKAMKLGVWSKGLKKGLTKYNKGFYDEEREGDGDLDLEAGYALEVDDEFIDGNLAIQVDGSNRLYNATTLEEEDRIVNGGIYLQNRNFDDDEGSDIDEEDNI